MKPCENNIQAVLMHYAMSDLNHELVIPNSTSIYSWEADLLSVTKSMFVHEYEIKINLADYRRDFKKHKHELLTNGYSNSPNYFWYATFEFDIEPPDYAGWIKIANDNTRSWPRVYVCKVAPRLHNTKLADAQRTTIARLLSWQLTNMFVARVERQAEA